jgi:hypothetical protein
MMIKVQSWQRTTSCIDRIKRICGDSLQHFYLLAGITGPVVSVLSDDTAAILSSGYYSFGNAHIMELVRAPRATHALEWTVMVRSNMHQASDSGKAQAYSIEGELRSLSYQRWWLAWVQQ